MIEMGATDSVENPTSRDFNPEKQFNLAEIQKNKASFNNGIHGRARWD
jgi:hypothetical protein